MTGTKRMSRIDIAISFLSRYKKISIFIYCKVTEIYSTV